MTPNELYKINGGVTTPKGFVASGVSANIKYSRNDMALIASKSPCSCAGVFTSNKLKGAHINVCKKVLKKNRAYAILTNAGCANACTGKQGIKDAQEMAYVCENELNIPNNSVFVCSTGTIGTFLPMNRVKEGIKKAVSALKKSGGINAAKAIMTTDTVHKTCAVKFKVKDKFVTVGAVAKGSGMIEPNMATMLSYITTDAKIDKESLKKSLLEAVNLSFNKITIDGDQSCNDTVLILANGESEVLIESNSKEYVLFKNAVITVCQNLAKKMVIDGEGATKFVTVNVLNAKSDSDAKKICRAVANSPLVKTSWFGGDPNWGRIINAVGYSGATVNQDLVEIKFDNITVLKNGMQVEDFNLKKLEKIYSKKSFVIEINLNIGKASDFIYTCDCSYEYVKINAEYMT